MQSVVYSTVYKIQVLLLYLKSKTLFKLIIVGSRNLVQEIKGAVEKLFEKMSVGKELNCWRILESKLVIYSSV